MARFHYLTDKPKYRHSAGSIDALCYMPLAQTPEKLVEWCEKMAAFIDKDTQGDQELGWNITHYPNEPKGNADTLFSLRLNHADEDIWCPHDIRELLDIYKTAFLQDGNIYSVLIRENDLATGKLAVLDPDTGSCMQDIDLEDVLTFAADHIDSGDLEYRCHELEYKKDTCIPY